MELHRRFTPLHLLLLSINGMIGSAWLFAPLYAAKIAGPHAIYAWLIGGLITALIALTFAELSVMLPVAGGSSCFPKLSHGTVTSFVMGWIAWISALTMAPIEVQAVLQYASIYFPSLMTLQGSTPVLSGFGIFWASIIMMLLCTINIVSFKGLVRSNLLVFTFKIGVILLTIVMLMSTQFHPHNFAVFPANNTQDIWHNIMTAVAIGGIAFAFTGFKHGVELAEEAQRSRFAIPLAIIGSITFCLALYIGLQIAFIGALPTDSLNKGWGQLTFSGDIGPFAGIAATLGLLWLLKLLYIDAAISPLGAGLIFITSTARILYSMSKSGYFPQIFTKLNKQHFPIYAILLNFFIGMLLFLPFPGWQAMVGFLVSTMVVSYAIGPIALLCLRKQLPNEERSFRLPFANIFCLLAFYCCNLMSYWTGWDTIWKFEIAIILSFIFFVIAILRGSINSKSAGLKSLFWLIPYFAGLGIISFLGAFGGKHIIPFGWDFIIIGAFSLIILKLALLTRIKDTRAEFDVYKQQSLEKFSTEMNSNIYPTD